MTRELVLFGTGKIGQVLHAYLARDSRFRLAGFTVQDEYLSGDSYLGLPACPFSKVREVFPPERFGMLVAMGYHDLNSRRADICGQAKALGYQLESYVDPDATVFDSVQVGENCIVLDKAIIQPYACIGDGTCVFSGAVVAHHTRVGAYCWITSGSVLGGNSAVGDFTFIGLGAVIGHNISVGRRNFLGAGALVTRSTQDNEVYVTQATPKYRLTSEQFQRFTQFD
jgi:sugar O-acyltransferase (sialic acid O-acetyltransferase NeuD family)